MKAISILLLILVLLLVQICSGCKAERKKLTADSKPIQFIDIKSSTIRGVIVPKEYFRMEAPYFSEHWTITNFDFDNMESQLEKYLRDEADLQRYKDLPNKFRKYKRQYVGEIKEGKKIIFINFFCDIPGLDNWKQDVVEVGDGGDCFFSIKYDIQTKKFSELWINGEA